MEKEILNESKKFLTTNKLVDDFSFRKIAKIKNGSVAILGMRRIGKTEYLKYRASILNNIEKTLFIDFDSYKWSTIDFSKLSKTREEFILKIGQIIEIHNIKLCLFDEIQRYPDWAKLIKSFVDSFPKTEFVVTGSDAIALNKSSEQGGGRFEVFYMGPLSFNEYCQLNKTKDFSQYINYFAYPQGNKLNINKKYRNIIEKQISSSKLLSANVLNTFKAITYNPGIPFTRYEAVKWIKSNTKANLDAKQVNTIIDFLVESQLVIAIDDIKGNIKAKGKKVLSLYSYDWTSFKYFSNIRKYENLPSKIDQNTKLKTLPTKGKVFENMIFSNIFTIYNTDLKRNFIFNKTEIPDIDLIIGNNSYEIKSFDVLNSPNLYEITSKAQTTKAKIIHTGKTTTKASIDFINFIDFLNSLN